MDVEPLEAINRSSGAGTLTTATVGSGVFWRSTHLQARDAHYRAEVPAGLHLACGLARLSSHAKGLGGFELDGGGLTAVLYPPDAMPAETWIGAGEQRSCGLSLPIDATLSPALEPILARMARGPRMRGTGQVPIGVVAGLCAPVDPWFQGHARELMLEARALELVALATSWLTGTDSAIARPPRHLAHARRARELLDAQLATPPTLDALARQVGTNARTLTAAFREVHGLSIASYVTGRRLELAHACLLQGMPVGAAAHRVGYSAAHFSNAYLRRYGIRPQAALDGMPTIA